MGERNARAADPESLALGEAIRSSRRKQSLTLKHVSDAAGVSQSLLSQVERGLASPSITTLRLIAAALDVPVASFFVKTDTAAADDIDAQQLQLVVRNGARKSMRVPRSRVGYELLTPDLNRQIEFLWIVYEPGSLSHPAAMSHPGEENAVCIEGEIVVTVDGREYTLEAGDSISFDSGRPHQVHNRTGKRAIVISAITPPHF